MNICIELDRVAEMEDDRFLGGGTHDYDDDAQSYLRLT